MRNLANLLICVLLASCQTQAPKESTDKHYNKKDLVKRQTASKSSLEQVFNKPGWVYYSTAEVKKFETLWAISDIHGSLDKLIALFLKAELIQKKAGEYVWKPTAAHKHLLVVVGDSINKGPDSVGVVRFLTSLQAQAREKGSAVILLLGNHEAEFLSNKGGAENEKETPELLVSANDSHNRDWLETAGKKLGANISFRELRQDSAFGISLSTFSVGAILGKWFFVHSGYIAGTTDEVSELLIEAGQVQADGAQSLKGAKFNESEFKYEQLVDDDSPFSSLLVKRDWTKNLEKLNDMKEKLDFLGVSTLFVGHDPGALTEDNQVHKEIAINKEGWLVKLDVGMSLSDEEKEYSKGRMLKCNLRKALEQPAMSLLRKGPPVCQQIHVTKAVMPIWVVENPTFDLKTKH